MYNISKKTKVKVNTFFLHISIYNPRTYQTEEVSNMSCFDGKSMAELVSFKKGEFLGFKVG